MPETMLRAVKDGYSNQVRTKEVQLPKVRLEEKRKRNWNSERVINADIAMQMKFSVSIAGRYLAH